MHNSQMAIQGSCSFTMCIFKHFSFLKVKDRDQDQNIVIYAQSQEAPGQDQFASLFLPPLKIKCLVRLDMWIVSKPMAMFF